MKAIRAIPKADRDSPSASDPSSAGLDRLGGFLSPLIVASILLPVFALGPGAAEPVLVGTGVLALLWSAFFLALVVELRKHRRSPGREPPSRQTDVPTVATHDPLYDRQIDPPI